MPMNIDAASEIIRRQHDRLKDALSDEAPFTFVDHKHLDANTPERAYWHYGYITALNDVLRLLAGENLTQTSDSKDKSN